MTVARKRRSSATSGARHAAASKIGGNPNRVLVTQDSTDRFEAKVFRAHVPLQGLCENLMNALKLLANQQTGGDSLVEVLVEGLPERIRVKMAEELRRFIMVDNHETVKIGYLEKTLESLSVVDPTFTADFPEEALRGGAGELTLRRVEAGTQRTSINTINVGDSSWRSSLVDEDWHAISQAIFKGVEGGEWERWCYKYVELHKEVNIKKLGNSHRARCKDTREAYYD